MDPLDHVVRVVLEDDIRNRLINRRFYRAHRWHAFAALETENTLILRALLQVRSEARRVNREAERRHERWAMAVAR